MTEKEIKSEIRKLKKLKKQLRAGTEQRLILGRQIKELQEKLKIKAEADKDKDPIIKEIKKRDKMFEQLGIDLRKFSKEELQKHLNKLQEKK